MMMCVTRLSLSAGRWVLRAVHTTVLGLFGLGLVSCMKLGFAVRVAGSGSLPWACLLLLAHKYKLHVLFCVWLRLR